MITVAEFHSAESLQELRLLWTELWSNTKNGSFFQSFDWFMSRQKQFRPDEEAFVLVVSMAGKPFGILPLVKQTTPTGIGSARRLTNGSAGWAAFGGPIGPNPTATLAASMRHLRNARRGWDVIDLRHIDADGADRGRTRTAMRTVGLRCRAVENAHTAGVLMNAEWPDYWTSRPMELQAEYNRAEHRLSVFGDVRYARFRSHWGSANARWDLFSAFLRADHSSIHPDSWSGRPSLTKSQQATLSGAHEAAVKAGSADVNLLYVNNRPAASAYNFVRDGRVEGVRFGVAADATYDAATVLLGLMLRDGFDRGDESYRFPVGDKTETTGWANHFETSHRLTHYPRLGFRAQLARLGDWLNEPHTPTRREPETIHVPTPPTRRPAALVRDREFAVMG